MKNLEQIRAMNALTAAFDGSRYSGQQDGQVIKKIPPIIKNHGLLAAAAFALGEKQQGWRNAFNAITRHLACAEIALVPKECSTVDDLIAFLTSERADSEVLKLATAETLAWFNYARRFIR
ncbi:MAG: type III-B CRISPR module-associated protein Cmr5 [Opitutales bacterium]